MALNDLIRMGVAVADKVTKSAQVNVIHSPWMGSDIYGGPSYGPSAVRPAIVEYAQRLRQIGNGQEIMQKASVLFVGPIPDYNISERRNPIDPRDQIFLPNGYTGPILSVEGVVDPSTNSLYTVEVILG